MERGIPVLAGVTLATRGFRDRDADEPVRRTSRAGWHNSFRPASPPRFVASASPMKSWLAIGRSLPGVEEGIACEGTALERRTLKVGKKAFLFLGESDARFKLDASIADAKARGCNVGATGWVTVIFAEGDVPKRVATRWIKESHARMAPARSTRS